MPDCNPDEQHHSPLIPLTAAKGPAAAVASPKIRKYEKLGYNTVQDGDVIIALFTGEDRCESCCLRRRPNQECIFVMPEGRTCKRCTAQRKACRGACIEGRSAAAMSKLVGAWEQQKKVTGPNDASLAMAPSSGDASPVPVPARAQTPGTTRTREDASAQIDASTQTPEAPAHSSDMSGLPFVADPTLLHASDSDANGHPLGTSADSTSRSSLESCTWQSFSTPHPVVRSRSPSLELGQCSSPSEVAAVRLGHNRRPQPADVGGEHEMTHDVTLGRISSRLRAAVTTTLQAQNTILQLLESSSAPAPNVEPLTSEEPDGTYEPVDLRLDEDFRMSPEPDSQDSGMQEILHSMRLREASLPLFWSSTLRVPSDLSSNCNTRTLALTAEVDINALREAMRQDWLRRQLALADYIEATGVYLTSIHRSYGAGLVVMPVSWSDPLGHAPGPSPSENAEDTAMDEADASVSVDAQTAAGVNDLATFNSFDEGRPYKSRQTMARASPVIWPLPSEMSRVVKALRDRSFALPLLWNSTTEVPGELQLNPDQRAQAEKAAEDIRILDAKLQTNWRQCQFLLASYMEIVKDYSCWLLPPSSQDVAFCECSIVWSQYDQRVVKDVLHHHYI